MIKVTGMISVFVEWKPSKSKENPNPNLKATTSVEEYEFDTQKKTRTDKIISRDYYEITFAKKEFPLEKLSKLKENVAYIFDIKDGWLTNRSYTRKDGTIGHAKGIFINSAELVKATPVDIKKKEDARKAKEADSPLPEKDDNLPW